jgi:hypothetical protein
MGNFLASLAVRCVALVGTVIVTCAVTQGLVRAASAAAHGDQKRAAEEALDAACSPVRLAADAVAALVDEVDRVAREIADQGPLHGRLPE